ncbi:PGAP1-like family protein [Candida parapsilosis]|uniref:GPI inositol-deacylase n=1 Tax=Candida parapsilosis TaxID=5480 RepID=A0A8X7TBV5_CANPA|nr:PGAP1-like family protein [Candida parapsilosis]KAF6049383.1 PGAP1-like family protein [Candida parapsilosis]KAF6057234.1 PGAP1-like family protein [Candida parapsilosis]KAF6066047.1 PGAP1-like family protein [Candida parapsilosis]KAI5904387.1 GPI inositol-deacylase [Candida parapsilosis]
MRPNSRLSKLSFYLTVLLGGFLVLLTLKSYTSKLNGPDVPSCRPVWMYPSYIKIHSFDQSHTKYASKYSIYLYREQGRDKLPPEGNGDNDDDVVGMELEGVPVLFIPGNAGNHRQARSIAARTSELYDELRDVNGYKTKLDFFTIDFNEDFTAFHGRTILDQAEYANEAVKFILDLYSTRSNPPKSVIVIGHSMGGIVARIMMTLPDYLPGSVEDILTLSSPHSTSPLTFDGDLSTIYSAVDKFWYCGFTNCSTTTGTAKLNQLSSVAHERLQNVALISITGGALDSTLPADYTTLGYLVPKSNGFTAFTTGIPQVWTPIDHLAIVWCQQLRTRIALALLELTSLRGTVTLQDRMRVYEQYFLTGFEDYAMENKQVAIVSEEDVFGKDADDGNTVMKLEPGRIYNEKMLRSVNVFKLNKDKDVQFTLLSKIPLQIIGNKKSKLSVGLYNETGDGGIRDVSSLQATIPNFGENVTDISDSSYDGPTSPMYSLVLNTTILKPYSHIVITQSKNERHELYCQLSTNPSCLTLESRGGILSELRLFTTGQDISWLINCVMMTNLKIPQAWSSLYVYKLQFKIVFSSSLEKERFHMFIRQWTDDPFESKWFINVGEDGNYELQLTMHGIAPFVPYKIQSDYGMNLQIWQGNEPVRTREMNSKYININVTIDIIASLKLLILRYRITIVGINIAIISMVMMLQFGQFGSTSKYPSFGQTLIYLNAKYWWVIMTMLVILNYVINIPSVNKLLHYIDPVVLTDYNKFVINEEESGFKSNELFLGLSQGFTIIGVLLYLCCNFIIWLTCVALMLVGTMLNFVMLKLYPTRLKIGSKRVQSVLFNLQVCLMACIVLLIPWYLPYQIVYLIGCVYQVINVLKYWPGRIRSKDPSDEGVDDTTAAETAVFNYQVSWLILMLWLLPINIPILIVFIHNLQINWTTPFSSHHNLLSILPILLMTYYNSNVKMEKRSTRKGRNMGDGGDGLPHLSTKVIKLIQLMLGYIVYYSLIYGSRHTFYLHHLFNLLCCLVWIVFYSHESAATTGEKGERR